MRSFEGYYIANFQGSLFSQKSALCGGSNVVKVDIPWSNYAVNLGAGVIPTAVSFDLRGSPAPLLSGIQSVWIDNSAGRTAIHVVADDTGHAAIVRQNAAGLFPIHTNGTSFTVYPVNIFDAVQSGTTRIIVSDAALPQDVAPSSPETGGGGGDVFSGLTVALREGFGDRVNSQVFDRYWETNTTVTNTFADQRDFTFNQDIPVGGFTGFEFDPVANQPIPPKPRPLPRRPSYKDREGAVVIGAIRITARGKFEACRDVGVFLNGSFHNPPSGMANATIVNTGPSVMGPGVTEQVLCDIRDVYMLGSEAEQVLNFGYFINSTFGTNANYDKPMEEQDGRYTVTFRIQVQYANIYF